MEETELRARLERLAERTVPPVQHPGELTAAVVSRHHAARRRQRALLTVAALVAAVFVSVPTWLSQRSADPGPAGPASSSGVYTVPTRGNLADEVDFLEAMRRRPWTTDLPGSDVQEPPLDTRRVVYAGASSVAWWVLVAGADPAAALRPDEGVDPADLDELGSVAIAWFTGPRNAAPEEMRVYGEPHIVDADEPTAVLSPTRPHPGPTGSYFALVAAPGDQILVRGLRWIEADGEISDDYSRQAAPDGVTVDEGAQVDGSIDLGVRYRVLRGGSEFSGRPVTEPAPDFVPTGVALARLRPEPPPAPGDAAVPLAIDRLISHLGVWDDVIDFTVLWAGDLPTPDGADARLTVLDADFGEGSGVYVTGALGWAGGGEVGTGSCGSETRPAGTRPEERIVVLRCGRGGGPEDASGESLVVVAPPGATTARALDDRGEQIASYALVDGVAVVPFPPDLASVAVIGADGATLDERAPMGEVDFGD